jgi:PadR family transcriptional regulator, regulatory protein PadR
LLSVASLLHNLLISVRTLAPDGEGFAVRKDKLEILQGTLDMLVLKTLTAGPLHGYSIVDSIQQLSSDVIKVEEGSLYPALHRMERRGWIVADWGYSENNRRAKFYRLTRPGRKQLESELSIWTRISQAISNVVNGSPTLA